jgi:hypothetical protein
MNFMKKDSYDIGDWVLDKDGRTVRIHADDMPDLPYEHIERSLEPEEVPEFKHHASVSDYGLTKPHFWDIAMKHCPLAMAKMCEWIDTYKRQVSWHLLFANRAKCRSRSCRPEYVKFHDLPFDIQYGILLRFFHEHEVQVFFMYMEEPFSRGAQITQIAHCLTVLEVNERNKNIK